MNSLSSFWKPQEPINYPLKVINFSIVYCSQSMFSLNNVKNTSLNSIFIIIIIIKYPTFADSYASNEAFKIH